MELPKHPSANDVGMYWTPSREELFVWLQGNAPSLAELYKGSVTLLFGPSVPGYTRFVSHAVREIRNRLPGALTGIESAGRVEYKGRLDDIAAEWKRAGIAAEAQPSKGEGVVPAAKGSLEIVLPRRLVRKIARLIEEHESTREKPRDAAVRLFEGAAPRNQRFREALRPVVVQWMEVCNWFMERTHDSGTTDEGIEPAELQKKFELFESTLLGIVRGVSTFFVNTEELDAILKKGPTPDNVEAAIARLGYGESNRYFFEHLDDPEWIRPLKEKGFFSAPPAAVKDEGDGTIGYSAWPESRFLVRMARAAPEIVAEVALGIPKTDNIRVHDDLADVALRLPGALAAKIVPEAKTWIAARHKILLDEKLAGLVEKLVEAGESAAALELTERLLEVLPDPHPIMVPEPVGHFDGWHYERILNKSIPPLIEHVGMAAFVVVCNLLDTAVTLSRKEGEDADSEDLSFVWRPAIEDGRGSSRGVTDPLVSSVLSSAMELVSQEKARLEEVVAELEKRRWSVFHRIALYVLREFADRGKALVADRLADPARFDSAGVSREYWLLAGREFAGLAETEKERVLAWIGRGPDLELYKTRIGEFTGEVVSEAEAKAYGNRWRRDHFAVVEASLTGQWKTRYEELVSELGNAEDVTAVRRSTGGAFSPPSPKSESNLSKMAIPEVVEFLKSWEPSREPMGERKSGLGSMLGMVVAADPARFTKEAQEFEGVDPTYVREFFQALLPAAATGRGVEWENVVSLAQWAVDQSKFIPGRTGGAFDQDPDWGWTRSAIARLLSAGFQADTLPVELRNLVWGVLEKLTTDENPTAADEEKYLAQKNTDAASLSINSVRGEALHAVIQYALWTRRGFDKRVDGKELAGRGFAEMPEVKGVLERHLDPGVDATLATRSVYGRWLPWLQFLDSQWFEKHSSTIFPTEEKYVALRDTAWTSYVVLCEPFDAVFAALGSEYRRAVEKIGTFPTGRSHLGDPDSRLAIHLMTLYWRAQLKLPTEEGLLKEFFTKAPDELRGDALGFVGRTLKNDTGEIAPEILERLKRLWPSRLETAAAEADKSVFRSELSQFGWWFVSRRFADDWSMDQLFAALRITGKVQADLWVVGRLRELSSAMSGKAIECLSLMVDGDEEGWGMLGWRDDAHQILETGIASLDEETRKAARALIHKLGGRGYFEFGRLLERGPE